MGLSPADATAVGAVCTMIALVAQAVINQLGAEKARRHELDLKRLEWEEERRDSGD